MPQSFIGFRPWQGIEPKVRIIFPVDISFDEKKAKIAIKNIAFAEEVILSNYPDFREAKWRPFQPEINWNLLREDMVTVYVVLKKFNPENNSYEISGVLHDTINKQNLDHKIVLTSTGYHNWSLNEIYFAIDYQAPNESIEGETDFSFFQNQSEAEGDLLFNALKEINQLPIYRNLKVQSFSRQRKSSIDDFLKSLVTISIKHRQPRSIYLQKKLNLGEKRGDQSFYGLLKPNERRILPRQPYNDKKISRLILDTRGEFFEPTLFFKILNENGQLVLNASLFSKTSPYFVKYYRNMERLKRDEQTLIINSFSIDQNKSEIRIANRFANILSNDLRNLTLIANGNLFVLVD